MDRPLDGPTLAAAIAELAPEVLVVRSTKVKADALAASPALQLVVRAGAGVNTIDLPAASARGIFVTNCPGTNAVATAELAFAHLLNADRRLADATADLRAGSWQKSKYSKGFGLKSRTLGVLGTGDIGKAVIARALAFEMNVIAWSPSLTPARAAALGVTRADSPVEVARAADALTVHLALTCPPPAGSWAPRSSMPCGPAPCSSTPAAARWWTRRPWPRRSSRRASASAWTSSPTSPPPTASGAARSWRCPACTAPPMWARPRPRPRRPWPPRPAPSSWRPARAR
ncbi:MAG: NAD(P)-dependent oxidoreductase [bacterium]